MSAAITLRQFLREFRTRRRKAPTIRHPRFLQLGEVTIFNGGISMANFIVFTVDHDQQQVFVDLTHAGSRNTALGTVLKYRDYCCHGAAYTPADLRRFADDGETQPADFLEEVP
jgi:hypothetical protein